MGIKDFMSRLGSIAASRNEGKEDLPDDVTTDKYLRSLRRQRRVQMEEVEKKRLIQQVRAFEKRRDGQYMGLKKDGVLNERFKKEKYCFGGIAKEKNCHLVGNRGMLQAKPKKNPVKGFLR